MVNNSCFECFEQLSLFKFDSKPKKRSRYTSLDGKEFSAVFREKLRAMKAVDPVSLQVSVITGFLSDSEGPDRGSGDNGEGKRPSDRDASAEDSARLKHSVNGTPTRELPQACIGTLSVNGLVRKENDFENSDSPSKPKETLANGLSVKENSASLLYNGSSFLNGEKRTENGVKEDLSSASEEKFIEASLMNGIVNNGYYRGDDESGNEKHSLESLTDVEAEEVKRGGSPPENIPRLPGYQGLHVDSGMESAASSWDRTVAEVKEHAVARLQEELRKAREELKLKDEEVGRLSRIRQEVESELEELTASLFQEAHNMVRVANEKQAAAEKALRESTMQVEVLTAEVAALKTLVLTSTPSRPNPHLHPQIDPKAKDDAANGNALFRKHRRSPSHFNLKYGRENSPPESPTKDPRPPMPTESVDAKDGLEVDPVMHRDFLAWKQSPTTDQSDPFIARIYQEDIHNCLCFSNTQLAAEVQSAVESGTIYIEAVNEKTKTHFPKKCALLEAARQCQYRMRLGDEDTWHSISQICRNRIIAVCDFLNYLNYIQRGLVKSSVHDVYWEIVRLRKEMVLARLGLPLST